MKLLKKAIFLIFLILPSIAMSSETAKYEVIKKLSDKIEIREYKKLILATVITDEESSRNGSFRTLFKFISGENEKNQEISMTTPVFKENIKNKKSMSFVMPSSFSQESMPQPNDKNIKIEFVKNSQFVAIQFSGRATDENFEKYKEILVSAVKENNLKADIKNPINAYYNTPWTLPFFKRNEVLLRLDN